MLSINVPIAINLYVVTVSKDVKVVKKWYASSIEKIFIMKDIVFVLIVVKIINHIEKDKKIMIILYENSQLVKKNKT
jgi:hypothetical protein